MSVVTPQFLALWFILSFSIFIVFTFVPWIEELMDTKRSMNTAVVLMAQGLAAIGAYIALY